MASEAVRREHRILLLPLLLGICAPWAAWALAGGVELWMVAAATFAMAAIYLVCVHRLGDREAELRKRLGRRYEPPPPELATVICIGLAASMLAPGLSVGALAAAVGFPRVGGEIRAYLPQAIAKTGAEIALLPEAMPLGSTLSLLADGTARMQVPRFGRLVAYAMPWHAQGSSICFGQWCLKLDPRSGRLRTPPPDDLEIGRVVSLGAALAAPAAYSGVPWELSHLFPAPLLRQSRLSAVSESGR